MLVLINLVILVFLMFFESYVGMYLWNNIIPPIFNLPSLTWLQTFAVSIVIDFFFKSKSSSNEKHTNEEQTANLIQLFITILIFWGIGAIVIHYLV